jgi:hypothetical protein
MNSLGLMVSMAGLIVLNINTVRVCTNNNEMKQEDSCVLNYNYIHIGLGCILFISCISFACVIQCMDKFKKANSRVTTELNLPILYITY